MAGGPGPEPTRSAALLRAVRFAAGMTVGFVAVFGVVGVVLAPLVGSLAAYLARRVCWASPSCWVLLGGGALLRRARRAQGVTGR